PCLVTPAGAKAITSFAINYPPTTVYKGKTWAFSADIQGNNLGYDDYDVTWTVSGTTNPDTHFGDKLDYEGSLLYVAANESATTLTITATSDFDTTKTETITVAVEEYKTNTLTIEGLSSINNTYVSVSVYSNLETGTTLGSGSGNVASGKVKVDLEKGYMLPWAATTENVYITLAYYDSVADAYLTYVYVGTGGTFDPDDVNATAKFAFNANDKTVNFSDFDLMPESVIVGFEITITGITGFDGKGAQIEVVGGTKLTGMMGDYYPTLASNYDSQVAGNEVTFILEDTINGGGWAGVGGNACCIVVWIGDDYDTYVYTAGKTLSELGLTTSSNGDDFGDSTGFTKYDFTGGGDTFSINFNQFVKIDSWW
ncbi:MAG: hypothetical protein LBI04_10460, partial [Treponema sp.]|nr:hypothetical protein [Treponema sp.]